MQARLSRSRSTPFMYRRLAVPFLLSGHDESGDVLVEYSLVNVALLEPVEQRPQPAAGFLV